MRACAYDHASLPVPRRRDGVWRRSKRSLFLSEALGRLGAVQSHQARSRRETRRVAHDDHDARRPTAAAATSTATGLSGRRDHGRGGASSPAQRRVERHRHRPAGPHAVGRIRWLQVLRRRASGGRQPPRRADLSRRLGRRSGRRR